MASQRTKFTVGLFIACGTGIALLAVIWLGMSRFLEKGHYSVIYFNESVQGLNIDSAVKYRGVSIGRVVGIGVAPDSKLIQVVLKIDTGQKLGEDIVAQLKMVGITGSIYVELDRKKEGDPDRSPPINFPTEYPIIASEPSEISEILRGINALIQGVEEVLIQIKTLDVEGISDKVKLTLDSINQLVIEADVKGISDGIKASVESAGRILEKERWDRIIVSVEEAGRSLANVMRKADSSMRRVEDTLAHVEGIVDDKKGMIQTTIEDFSVAMKNTNMLLEKGTSLIDNTDVSVSRLGFHLIAVAENLKEASENLNRLIEIVSDRPSQLIFGDPPKPREVDSDNY